MGISVVQWRGSIGTFCAKFVSNKSKLKYESNYDFFMRIIVILIMLVEALFLPVRVISGLIVLFSYCTMIVTLMPVLLTSFYFCSVILNSLVSWCSSPIYKIPLYIVHAFLITNSIPKVLSYSTKVLMSYLINSLSAGIKIFSFFLMVLQALLIISGTVELNPGPAEIGKNLSFAVWNLDSLPARDYARIPLIESFQATYNFDIFGICESSLCSNIPNNDIFINGFSPDPFRADKPARNGGVCVYYKENLPIRQRCDLQTLPETIVAEVRINRKKKFLCPVVLSSKPLI